MSRRAFSLVELLTVIAIIGVLVGLLLPALQSARESARRTACGQNLRQIALAILNHVDRKGHFPYGGWGHEWVGVPGRSGPLQPGSWTFSVLPYIDQTPLYKMSGEAGYTARLTTPFGLFICPTRRDVRLRPVSPDFSYVQRPKPGGEATLVARGDYAINSGATLLMSFPGPPDLASGDSHTFSWPDLRPPNAKPQFVFSGVSHLRSGIRLRQLEDGASNTYLVGEKYLDPDAYENGESLGDNESLFSGYCSDLHRFTAINAPPLTPAADGSLAPNARDNFRFGSAHASGSQFAICDGSLRIVQYEVDAEVHYRAGHVADLGAAVP